MGYHDKLQPGTMIDYYRIEAPVATSGMATIYRATDTRDERPIALKVPLPNMEADMLLFDRFQREAAIGIKLDHPLVMHVYPHPKNVRVYMAMEWCEGRLLRHLMDEGRLPLERSLRIFSQLLEALDYIHSKGVVHRDLKPENIMVDEHDNIKLIDFGIAGDAEAKRLTYANFTQNLGSPDYISPEQVQGKRGDARTDLYTAGIILYEMLTGKLPFTGPTPLAAMNDRLLNHPTPPSVADPTISPELQEVIYRAIERKPQNRYARATDFLNDLNHLDKVGVDADRIELHEWQKRKSHNARKAIYYSALALIPVAILLVMVLLAHHR